MGKCDGGSRVGQVVRRHINCLNGGNGTLIGRGDALLQFAHFIGKGRLIANRRGHSAEQRGYLRARLQISENVIHKQQYILMLHVAEILRHGQTRLRDSHS